MTTTGFSHRRHTHSPSFSTFAVAGAMIVSPWMTGPAAAQAQVTFAKDIAPILQRSCENCHRKGGVAPMSLSTYEEVRPWARAIKTRTAQRDMPPWFIEKDIGIQKFKDDPSLSDREIATIAKWADSGAPLGNPADMPPARQYADSRGWTIGTPDLIISSPVATVKAAAADWFGPLEPPSPTGLTEDRYIKAVEVKEVRLAENTPDNPAEKAAGRAALNIFVVHHAVVEVARESREDAGAGAAEAAPREGLSVVYELGQNATIFPEDVGVKLPAGSVVTFDKNHFHSVGRDITARIDVAFTFHPKGFKPKYVQSSALVSMGALRDELDIPPGQDNVMFDSYYRMPRPGIVSTFEPHMHASGTRMCVEAIYPSGQREMMNCARYDHNWVKTYIYDDDVAPLLPTGTMVHVMGWYNNTSKNRRVVDPRNWKGWGNRSIDDMFINLPKVVWLTESEFKEELKRREAKQQRGKAATSQNNND